MGGKERILSFGVAAEPGRFQTSRCEYMREVMDCIGNENVRRVVCMKAAQVGYSEALMNTTAYYIIADPSPILFIFPTIEAAECWSKERLAPMIRDNPAVRDLVSEPRSRDSTNTIRAKQFAGGLLSIVGANSPSGLASRAIRIVLADEVDKYPSSAGKEGNPLALAAERQITFWNRKTLVGSTPTIKGASEIEHEYLASDQRRYFVPCGDCGHSQTLRWENVRWDKTPSGVHRPDTAHMVCEECGSIWDDLRRNEAVQRGKWIAERPFFGVAGFHIPGLLSPWLPLSQIVSQFLESRNDPERLKAWVNSKLGETWEDLAETVDGADMVSRGESYDRNSVPEEVLFITAGVDVQADRLEILIMGWGPAEESWAIDYEVLRGDTSLPDIWASLDELLLERFHTQDGRSLPIRAACIDAGFRSECVFAFTRKRRARRGIFATRGVSNKNGPKQIWPKMESRAGLKGADRVWMVGVDSAKESIYGRIRIKNPGPGFMHFPVGAPFDSQYFEQLTSERLVTVKKNGKVHREWQLPSGKRNEVLDTTALALAARLSTGRRVLRTPDRRESAPIGMSPPTPPGPIPRPAAMPQPAAMPPPTVKQSRGSFASRLAGAR